MLVSNVTPEVQQERDEVNRNLANTHTMLFIRQQFSRAITTLEAESWITIATEKGFLELALEMQNDLESELHTTLS